MKNFKMDYYQPTNIFEQKHTLLYTFQYENAFAQFVTTMGGNVSGGGAMDIELDCGISAPFRNEINKKHVLFEDEPDHKTNRTIAELKFFYPDGDYIEIEIEECADYLVGVQIIGYQEGE